MADRGIREALEDLGGIAAFAGILLALWLML